jgi:Domain of unknown function DUF29
MATKWQELAASSHYQTAVAVKTALAQNEFSAAAEGIEELIDALTRSEKRAVKSHLIRLMAHIVKWHTQPNMRSRSWVFTIRHARREIADTQEETPSLTREVIEAMMNTCFERACEQAEEEMGEPTSVKSLTWQQVFDDEYELSETAERRRRDNK